MKPTDLDYESAERLLDFAAGPHTRREAANVIADALAAKFVSGQEAMRERAVAAAWALSDTLSGRDDMLSEQGMVQRCAAIIRALTTEPADARAKENR